MLLSPDSTNDGTILDEVLVGCRDGESEAVQSWLEGFPRLPLEGVLLPYGL